MVAEMTPLKRAATPEDVVGPILFLLSDASQYMTGQVLWVNGGSYMP
jgi:3-oxoacyl-[acyl-carrier protein] reductase